MTNDSQRDYRTFAFLNLGHAYDHFFMLIFPTVVLALQKEWQTSYGDVLTLGTVGFIAFGLGTLPAGWLGDRWNRRSMMTVFFLGLGIGAILTGLAQNPWQLACGLGLLGLFASIYHPVGIAMVVQTTTQTGKALGINGVFGNLGIALAGITSAILAEHYGWRAAFFIPGVVALATGLAFAALCGRARTVQTDKLTARPAEAIGREAQLRIFIVIAIASLFGGLVFNALSVAMPKLFEERLLGLADSLSDVGVLVSVVFAVAALAQLVVGHFLDRYGVKAVFVIVAGLQAPLLILASGASGWELLFAATALMLFVFGEIPVTDWLVGRYASAAWRSRVYALKYMVSLGVSALAVPMVALLHESSGGFTSLLLVLAGSMSIVTLAALCLPVARTAIAATVAWKS